MFNRRDVLKKSAVLAGTLSLLGLDRLSAKADTGGPDAGELYEGFLLLPQGTQSPPQVVYPVPGPPVVCGVSGGKATAVAKPFERHDLLRKESGIPLYAVNNLPPSIQPDGGYLIEQEWGSVFLALLGYKVQDSSTGLWEAGMSLTAQPTFPRPFPFWYGPSPTGVDGIARGLWPVKVSFLPAPGLQVTSTLGQSFYWISRNVLYTLKIEHPAISSNSAQAIAAALVDL